MLLHTRTGHVRLNGDFRGAKALQATSNSEMSACRRGFKTLTLLDLMLQPTLVPAAKEYFTNVQTKTVKYRPLMAASDQPAIWLNAEKMAKYRDQMRKFYYDPTKYATYLEQLGIKYPTVPAVVP